MNLPRFSVNNPVAINLLMAGIIAGGIYVAFNLVREFFPNFEAEQIYIAVPYPGAAPEEIEKSVTRQIEREIQDVRDIKEINSSVLEGLSLTIVTMEPNADREQAANDIRGELDKVKPRLPKDTEDPEITLVRPMVPVIAVAVYGDVPEDRLHDAAVDVRESLLDLDQISQVITIGQRRREIWAEIQPEKLEEHGLTFDEVGTVVAATNMDLPGGQLRGSLGNVGVRTLGEGDQAIALEDMVIQSFADGTAVHLKDVANVRDTFEDKVLQGRFAGKPAVLMMVFKTPEEDALKISQVVKQYVAKNPTALGGAVSLGTTIDLARFIDQRLDLMLRNAKWGLLFVGLTLAFFLDLRVAFWVAVGLPISFLGTFIVMHVIGMTINLLSMFALVVVLGLIVDDAIVIGENVFTRLRNSINPHHAAVEGTNEVARPVLAAVVTTCTAFVPLAFIDGEMGTFMAVLPTVMIAALSVSLIEAFIILPSHLAHRAGVVFWMMAALTVVASLTAMLWRTEAWDYLLSHPGSLAATVICLLAVVSALAFWNRNADSKLRRFWLRAGEAKHHFIEYQLANFYEKALRLALRWRYAFLFGSVGFSLITVGLVTSGLVPFVFIQKVDGEMITISLETVAGTTESRTREIVSMIEQEALKLPELAGVFSVIGSAMNERGQETAADPATVGQLTLELKPADERTRTSDEIEYQLHEKTEKIPGVNKLRIRVENGGPGGADIEVRVRAADLATITKAVDYVRSEIGKYPSVVEVDDDLNSGKLEARLELRDSARALGITTRDLALQVRHALFGFEAQRLQNEEEEIRVRVLLPERSRRGLDDLGRLRVPTRSGGRVPLEEVCAISTGRGFATLARVDGKRAATVRAEVNTEVGNVSVITADLQQRLANIADEIPGASVTFEGQQRQIRESFGSLYFGYPAALLAIYALIAILFRSYSQPIIVMIVIPYAIVGALLGHFIMGYPFTFFSMIGVVALSGVVVNDSLILVDFINQERIRNPDASLFETVVKGGRARMRAIMLTTVTTGAGLAPIMLESSFQAQFLIPMAVSIVFGLIFGTVLTLLLLPTIYLIFEDCWRIAMWLLTGKWKLREITKIETV